MLTKFSKFALSKNQLKAISGGGVECTYTLTWPDGTQYQDTGACAGSSVSDCNGYMQQNCSVMSGTGGTCAYSCYQLAAT